VGCDRSRNREVLLRSWNEVARRFGLEQAGHIDLAVENRRQLVAAGVPELHIDVQGLCTFCDPGKFFLLET
jgi:copper oxidase (laccase) domain-containing protein